MYLIQILRGGSASRNPLLRTISPENMGLILAPILDLWTWELMTPWGKGPTCVFLLEQRESSGCERGFSPGLSGDRRTNFQAVSFNSGLTLKKTLCLPRVCTAVNGLYDHIIISLNNFLENAVVD